MTTGLFSSRTDEWATPKKLFAELDAEFHFDLDPCATPENAKCKNFYTADTDGLTQNWGGAKGLLQSPVWQSYAELGPEVLHGIPEGRDARCYAYPGPDGYFLLPRLHIQESTGNPFYPGPSALQRRTDRGTVPVYDSRFLAL